MGRTVRTAAQRVADEMKICRLFDDDVSIADIVRTVPLARSTISQIVYRRRNDGRPLHEYLASLEIERPESPEVLRQRALGRERQRRKRERVRLGVGPLRVNGRIPPRNDDARSVYFGLRESMCDGSVRNRVFALLQYPAAEITQGRFATWTLDAVAAMLPPHASRVPDGFVATDGEILDALFDALRGWACQVDASGEWRTV